MKPQATPVSDVVGKTIGPYQITGEVGKGGMGAVYKAYDPQLERDVALKLMDPLLARDEAFMKRFRIEAKALARLNHSNIVKVHALQDTDLGVCIAMEFVHGVTLAEIIQEHGALELKRVFHLFRQILSAFEYAHKAGVIHRDIKPSNIMVTESDEIKVTDFGLAKMHRHSSATATQLTGGTLYYVSPEQLEGLANVDHRGDIYSIGMTLYEGLTGAVPFEKTESDFRIRERIVHGKVPPPRNFNASLPKRLNDLVMKAIARDPRDRFQTVSEMMLALKEVEEGEAGRRDGQPTRKKGRRFAITGIVVVAVGAVLFFVFKRSSQTYSVISVSSNPTEARVTVNGIDVGRTPLQGIRVARGVVRMKVEKPDYAVIDTQFSVSLNEHLSLTWNLRSHDVNAIAGHARENEQAPPTSKIEAIPPPASDQEELPVSKKPTRPSGESGSTGRRSALAEKTKIATHGNEGPVAERTPEELEAERAAVEKFEKEKKAAEESARAKKSLQGLVDKYKSAFEAADLASLKSLLQFSEKETDAWSKFFDLAKDVKVSIEDLDVQNGSEQAQIAFKAKLSYLNTSNSEQASNTIRNSWACENVGGKWVVVSHKTNQ